ncbi:MAG: NAD(P)/FAD-dependent oxidoreductase [Clostridiales bacterium]|jgi:flavin-dependent dehydrogenase|nr:NAD(P)/FAD-dependent oxidoreductase [Clostridiales bacterium]
MKIAVIGAGEGGLTAAYYLAVNGCDVEVYEKLKRGDLGYDWHDVVSGDVFSELDIDLPSQCFFKTRDWSFLLPLSEKWLKLAQNPAAYDYSIERKPLIDLLISRAESAGAKLLFNKKVDKLIIEGKEIKGIAVGSKRVRTDIVIDSSGAFSRFRASLPHDADIQNTPSSQEIFFAYRAFFPRKEGVGQDGEHTNRCYIKPLGISGIAWCIQDPPSGNFDILIGKTGFMTKNDVISVMSYLRRDNPAVADAKPVRGGDAIRPIPVRYPLSKMVADGYAAIGDAAFMTIPLLGSGIASSMRAGKMLADAINANKTSLAAGLWDYQVKFMTKIGAKHAAIDILKRWLLEAKDTDLKYIIDSGLITEKDLAASSSGDLPALTPLEIIQKSFAGKDNIPLLLKLTNLINKSKNVHKTGLGIPEKYNEQAVRIWKKKFDELFAE